MHENRVNIMHQITHMRFDFTTPLNHPKTKPSKRWKKERNLERSIKKRWYKIREWREKRLTFLLIFTWSFLEKKTLGQGAISFINADTYMSMYIICRLRSPFYKILTEEGILQNEVCTWTSLRISRTDRLRSGNKIFYGKQNNAKGNLQTILIFNKTLSRCTINCESGKIVLDWRRRNWRASTPCPLKYGF